MNSGPSPAASGTPEEVREFIAEQIGEWLNDETFLESLAGHLEGDTASQARKPILLARLRQIASLVAPKTRTRTVASPQPRAASPRPPAVGQSAVPGFGAARLNAPVPLPGRVLLRSSALRSAAYDANTLALTIEFQSGRVYVYRGVPLNVYAGLVHGGSHGKYFNQWIKGRY